MDLHPFLAALRRGHCRDRPRYASRRPCQSEGTPPTGGADLKGYPGKTFRNGTDCTLIVDISDLGFQVTNGKTAGSDEHGVDPCVLAEQFGGMAVMNLPDAPPAG